MVHPVERREGEPQQPAGPLDEIEVCERPEVVAGDESGEQSKRLDQRRWVNPRRTRRWQLPWTLFGIRAMARVAVAWSKLAWSARESEPTGQWSDTGNNLPSQRYRVITRRAVPRLTGKVNRERTGLKPDVLHCTDGQRLAQPIRISFSVH